MKGISWFTGIAWIFLVCPAGAESWLTAPQRGEWAIYTASDSDNIRYLSAYLQHRSFYNSEFSLYIGQTFFDEEGNDKNGSDLSLAWQSDASQEFALSLKAELLGQNTTAKSRAAGLGALWRPGRMSLTAGIEKGSTEWNFDTLVEQNQFTPLRLDTTQWQLGAGYEFDKIFVSIQYVERRYNESSELELQNNGATLLRALGERIFRDLLSRGIDRSEARLITQRQLHDLRDRVEDTPRAAIDRRISLDGGLQNYHRILGVIDSQFNVEATWFLGPWQPSVGIDRVRFFGESEAHFFGRGDVTYSWTQWFASIGLGIEYKDDFTIVELGLGRLF